MNWREAFSALKASPEMGTYLALFTIILATLFVRLTLGFEFPIPWNDETAFISQAFEFSKTGSFYVYGLNAERTVMWMPPGFMLVLALIYKVTGYSFEVSRWIACFFYIGMGVTAIQLVRSCLNGRYKHIGLGLFLLAFLSPYTLVISNISRMESLYSFIFLLSLLAIIKERYGLGLSLVLVGATVHFNAIYFLLPFAVLIAWQIATRKSLTLRWWELLALAIAAAALGGYGLYVLKNIPGFIEDMHFQFAYKLGSPVMGGAEGWRLLAASLCIPAVQILLHRRIGAETFISLYGVSFIAMSLNGHNMWYLFGFPLGFWLIAMGVLASLSSQPSKAQVRILICLALTAASAQGFYSLRSNPQHDPFRPSLGKIARDFIHEDEISNVREFIRTLPPQTTVSFGYTGVEPYFFEDFEKSGAQWTGSAHSVTQVFPARNVDYRVFCDSVMVPAYLSAYDWDGYPRKSQDTGCSIVDLRNRNERR